MSIFVREVCKRGEREKRKCNQATAIEKEVESNHQLYQPSQKPKQREVFFKELKKGYGFKKAVKRCYPKKYLKNIVKTVLYNMKFMGGQNRYQVIVVMATKGRLK